MTSGAGRDPRFDVLFEPVAIGPVTAKNRFFQVPHCNGMGYRDPTALAWMRGVKAEGGWAVVCTEEVEIHPTSDVNPYIELRLWDDRDIPMLARTADRIHEFGALAGIELCHNGPHAANHYAREVPLAASAMPVAGSGWEPLQARAMDRQDIRDLRRWHRAAALRARQAGSTSSTSTPGTRSASCTTSSPAITTNAATNTAALRATACACSKRSSATPGMPWATPAPCRAGSPSTSCLGQMALSGRRPRS